MLFFHRLLPGQTNRSRHSVGTGTLHQPESRARPILETLEDRTVPSSGWAIPVGWSAQDVAVDNNGGVAVVGKVISNESDFDPTEGTSTLDDLYRPVYVARYLPQGTLDWVQPIGSRVSSPTGWSVAVDDVGDVYVTGMFQGEVTFGVDGESRTSTSPDTTDAFITKFDGGDGTFEWVTTLAGPTGQRGGSITAGGPDNHVYVTGNYSGVATFEDGSSNPIQLNPRGAYDLFVAELDSDGTVLQAIGMGGPGNEFGRGIAVDADGGTYVTGQFYDTATFGQTSGGTDVIRESRGGSDSFLVKLNADGSTAWARTMGSNETSGTESGTGIAVADVEDGTTGETFRAVYVSGIMEGTNVIFGGGEQDPTTTTFTTGDEDVFVAQFDADGVFRWAKQLGGAGGDRAAAFDGLAVDDAGNVFTTGYFGWNVHHTGAEADFNPDTADPQDPGDVDEQRILTTEREPQLFLSMLDVDGNYVGAWQAESAFTSEGHGVAVGPDGTVHVAGQYTPDVELPFAIRLEMPEGSPGEGLLWKLDPGKRAITGTVFNDLNNDGSRNLEPGIQGWTIYIDANNNGALDSGEQSTTTNIEGNYALNVEPQAADHVVRVLVPQGWQLTAPTPDGFHTVSVPGTGDVSLPLSGYDFGAYDDSIVAMEVPGPTDTAIKSTTLSTITISESMQIVDIDVEVNLTVADLRHLTGTLIAPNGAEYSLWDLTGSPGGEFSETIFDHEAETYIDRALSQRLPDITSHVELPIPITFSF